MGVSPTSSQSYLPVRKGLKRVFDGTPFTADDNYSSAEELIQSKYVDTAMALRRAEKDQFVKVDDFTIRIDFANPSGSWIDRGLRRWNDGLPVALRTSLCVKRFHPDYTPVDGKDPQLQFQEMMDAMSWPMNASKTERAEKLWPYRPVAYADGQQALLERNPYFCRGHG